MIHQMAPMAPLLARPAAACRRLIVATAIATMAMVTATSIAPAQTVVAVVNGEPITALDVESRMKFMLLTTQKQPARPDTINELIDEKLKVKEGKRWGIELTDAEVDSMYANMASRMRQSADQLTQGLQKGGVNPQTLKSRIRADSVWQQLVRGRFAPSLQLNEKDVELALQAKNQSGEATTATEYTLRPILFLVAPGSQPATFDAKRKEAEALRARFKGCQEGLVVARTTGAVVRDQVIRNSGDLKSPELRMTWSRTTAPVVRATTSPSWQPLKRARSASASLRLASNVAGCEPGATRNRIGRRVYSVAVVASPDWFLACKASSTSFSLSCRLGAKRPRTSCCQTESARMRDLSVCGLTPPFCRPWVSWSADCRMRLAMFAYMESTSASVSSMPQRLPSLTLSFSSMSSLIVSGRAGCFWVVSSMNFIRDSTSSAVIGSPLTTATTVWAGAIEVAVTMAMVAIAVATISRRHAAAGRAKRGAMGAIW